MSVAGNVRMAAGVYSAVAGIACIAAEGGLAPSAVAALLRRLERERRYCAEAWS